MELFEGPNLIVPGNVCPLVPENWKCTSILCVCVGGRQGAKGRRLQLRPRAARLVASARFPKRLSICVFDEGWIVLNVKSLALWFLDRKRVLESLTQERPSLRIQRSSARDPKARLETHTRSLRLCVLKFNGTPKNPTEVYSDTGSPSRARFRRKGSRLPLNYNSVGL